MVLPLYRLGIEKKAAVLLRYSKAMAADLDPILGVVPSIHNILNSAFKAVVVGVVFGAFSANPKFLRAENQVDALSR